jgi:RNA polymerase sigma factor (TIGR02999 family)
LAEISSPLGTGARVPAKAVPGIDVTGLLHAWQAGDELAFARLMELVYQDLRRAAHRYMINERLSHTLQTTALIHETYLRLVDVRRMNFQDRSHFFAMCARLMRRILIDSARDRKSKKRGGSQVHISLESEPEVAAAFGPDLLAIDDALSRLAAIDDRKAKVVELRFYGGLTEEETAVALNISVETVARDWKFSKSWLRKELGRSGRNGE